MDTAFSPAISIKIVEVAKKYNQPDNQPITHVPEYTRPGGPNAYICTPNVTSWTNGFFAGLIWLLVERQRLLPGSVHPTYTEKELVDLARRWEYSFRSMARPAQNHDQGFRFQLSYGHDYALTGSEDAKNALVEAAESLVDRFNPKLGMIRSWDELGLRDDMPVCDLTNLDDHFLVIIDNMMNLDLLFQASEITGDEKFAQVAISQAERSAKAHVRPNFTTYHCINLDTKTGAVKQAFSHQGLHNESTWSRGQAWAMYGFAQCALRTGRDDFLAMTLNLAKVFLDNLPASGVPWWDFDAPQPCPYDASAGCVAARALQMLYQLLQTKDPKAAGEYLQAAEKLIDDILRECYAPEAQLVDGVVDWGQDKWETVLMHSTIAGNVHNLSGMFFDHGLVYADYYMLEFGNAQLKLQKQ